MRPSKSVVTIPAAPNVRSFMPLLSKRARKKSPGWVTGGPASVTRRNPPTRILSPWRTAAWIDSKAPKSATTLPVPAPKPTVSRVPLEL